MPGQAFGGATVPRQLQQLDKEQLTKQAQYPVYRQHHIQLLLIYLQSSI